MTMTIDRDGFAQYSLVTCHTCDGDGEVHSHNPICYSCGGLGLLLSNGMMVPRSLWIEAKESMKRCER